MASIAELLARAAALRDETALNSISPERAGGIMYDTLVAMNELWLQQGAALVISKIYASVEAMEADTAPVSDLTGQALRPGQIVVIASSDEDNGSVYRYDGPADPSWSAVGNIGAVPVVDDLTSDSSVLALAARQGKVLDEKVEQVGRYVDPLGWVRVVTDSSNKILYGIKTDGKFYFGAGCPPQVKEYVLARKEEIEAELTTKVDKVVGESLINAEVAASNGVVETSGWLRATTDINGKIVEGINESGEKFIGAFDDKTKELIQNLINIPDPVGEIIKIERLDTSFVSPIPVTITGTKGEPDAKYDFQAPLKNAWNIRVKFKIREDILKENKTAVIASINGAAVVAYPIALSQCITDSDNKTAIDVPYDGPYFENKWPAYSGGVCFNTQTKDAIFDKMNIGRQAFSIRYVGAGDSVTVENNGSAIVFEIDGVSKSFSFTTYPTVNELYEAISADSDFDVVPIALDYHDSSELAVFTPVQLVSALHGNTDQTYHPAIAEYTDNGPLYLHYSVNEDWHQIEIVKVDDKIYSVCDGNVLEYTELIEDNILTLGGNCGVLFKDLEIHTNSVADFEYAVVPSINYAVPISSVNPYIVIFEAHAVNTYPTCEQPTEEIVGYNQNIDGLDWCFAWCKDKGYVPVSVKDIEDYYIFGKPLPKRCYTIILDGWHWDTALNLSKRAVFEKYGVKPCLAIEKRPSIITPIIHNGQEITIAEAVKIARVNGYDVVNHTINHTSTYAVKPSDRVAFVTNLVYNFEVDGIDGLTYTFPGGCTDPYMNEVFEYLGIKAGVEITRGAVNNLIRNRFALGRLDISTTYTKNANDEWIKINYNPGKLIKVI